jgi:chloride channel protein, CIC family
MTNNAESGPNRRMLARFIEAQGRDAPLMFWALVVGAGAGLTGAAFRAGVTGMGNLRSHFDSGDLGFGAPSPWRAALLSALAVMAAVWLVRRFAPEAGGSGVQEVEGALDGLRPMRWQRVLPVKFGAGLLSLGSGLLMGREGPTIQMGAALGRMLSETFGLRPEHAHVLLAAGGGAGLTAAFNAPLAGMLFVIEEMRPQFHYNALSVQAVLIACATSDIVVRSVLGGTLILPMPALEAPPLEALWIFPFFGALIGLIGYAFNGLLLGTVDRMARTSERQRLLLAGCVGGIVGWLAITLPNAVGGGEALIERALTGAIPTLFLLALFLGRFLLTVASYGTGAPGGIFAPMLALGTLFGLWFGQISHGWIPALLDHPEVYTVAAMGALFSATVRAPITGIALAMELTGGYSQLLPIVLTCIPATLVAHGLGGMPIYTLLLERVLRDADTENPGRLILYYASPDEAGGEGQETVARLAQRLNLEWLGLDIQGDPELQARYGSRLPVVEFDGIEIGSGELSERGLEEGIKRVAAGTGTETEESSAPGPA